jgi:hypothetical protein
MIQLVSITQTSFVHRYSVCIRQSPGFDCIQYIPCADDNSWTLDQIASKAIKNAVDQECVEDYIQIQGATGTCCSGTNTGFVSRICGNVFGSVSALKIVGKNIPAVNQPVCGELGTHISNLVSKTFTLNAIRLHAALRGDDRDGRHPGRGQRD